jgi:cytochrome P450
MAAYAQQLSDGWDDGQETDVHEDVVRLSLNIVMKTLFNTDGKVDVDALGAHFKVILENALLFYVLPYPERLLRLPIPRLRAVVGAMNYLDSTIYGMVAERRRAGTDEGDLLSAFIAARDIDGDGEGMSDRQIRDECVSAFAAGHATTANAVAWCLYLLARHPDVAEKVHGEISAVLGGRPPAFDDYPRLRYTKMVLSESMRLYPPAWHLSRRVLRDYAVGGYTIPARSVVMINPWLMHRDAHYFPDPLRFDPERFAPGAQPTWPPFCYLPFGAGVRSCVGEGFAWLAGVTILAVLVRDWTFHLKDDRPVEPAPLMIVRPKGGLPMILRKRMRHESP